MNPAETPAPTGAAPKLPSRWRRPARRPHARVWQSTPPPKDRPVVVVGQVCWNVQFGGGVIPFCGIVRWKPDADVPEGGHWLYDDCGTAVATEIEDRVVIFQWIDKPEATQ